MLAGLRARPTSVLATTGRLHHRHRRQLGEYERQNVHSGAITLVSTVPACRNSTWTSVMRVYSQLSPHFGQLYPGTDVGRAESPANIRAGYNWPTTPSATGDNWASTSARMFISGAITLVSTVPACRNST